MLPGSALGEPLLSTPPPPGAGGLESRLTDRVEKFHRGSSEFATLANQLGTARDTRSYRRTLGHQREILTREAKGLLAELGEWKPSERGQRAKRDRLLRQMESAVGGFRGSVQLSLRKERMMEERMSGAEGLDDTGGKSGNAGSSGKGIYASSSGTLPIVMPGSGGKFSSTQDDDDKYNTALGDAVAQQRLRAQRSHVSARAEAELAAERREEIRQLEGDIVDLAQVFQECAQLVQDQGEELDTIEAHVGQAVERTERGVMQLEEASKYQKKSRKKMCILLMLIMGIAIATALPFILKHKRAAKDA